MSNASPILLILGSGPRVGNHVAQAFSSKGYKVVAASRKPEASTPDQVRIPTDLSDPESVKALFANVKSNLGHPSVVVYNGKHITYRKYRYT